ncbi:MAG: hypothetical protein E6J01_15385 [Chloroflexi bacterium]|nr:MAG: hypothetical protein E6J01_15385 [Chloroflexota bacterium]
MGQDHAARNTEGLDQLRELVRQLRDLDLTRPVGGDGWTVSSTLAHLAFWDNVAVERWTQFDRRGAFTDMADPVFDIVNAAALEQWRALPPRLAADQAVAAAEAVAARIAGLSASAVEAAVTTGRPFMVDRTIHWTPHLREIDRALG